MEMDDAAPKVRRWLVTGVSSGLGRAIAEHALSRGDFVTGTLRKPEQFEAFAALSPGRAFPIALDVTDDGAVGPAVAQAMADMGGLDVLVNNAGYALMGAAEDVSLAEARRQMDTNFFGLLNTCQAVLPHFRAQGRGRIVNVASVAAIMGFPMNSMYVASKHAVAGFSEALAKEVARFGVRVTSVEPGGFRTEFGTGSLNLPAQVSETYAEITAKLKTRMTDFAHLAANDPAKGAAVIAALVDLDEPVNGWVYPLDLRGGRDVLAGSFDAYLRRAVLARFAIWGPPAEEVVYMNVETDSAGAPLDGALAYRLRFEGPPPAKGFWSFTVYDAATRLLAAHPSGRYKLGDRDRDMVRGEDGSLTIYLQHEPPVGAPLANWLPVPQAPFQVVGRLYWPEPELLDKRYRPPPLTPAQPA